MKYFSVLLSMCAMQTFAMEPTLDGNYVSQCQSKRTFEGTITVFKKIYAFFGNNYTVKTVYYRDFLCLEEIHVQKRNTNSGFFEIAQTVKAQFFPNGPVYNAYKILFKSHTHNITDACIYLDSKGYKNNATFVLGYHWDITHTICGLDGSVMYTVMDVRT